MSEFSDLESFVGKKDLSKTAKAKIVKILTELSDDVAIEEIVLKLLVFPQDVVGNYLLQTFEHKSESQKDEFVAFFTKKVEPIKFGHLFRAFTVFRAFNDDSRAFTLLFSKMETDFVKTEINKQIFQGLDKTIKECGFEPFLVVFEEGQKRNQNIFAQFLLQYYKYNKSEDLLQNVTKFYQINSLKLPKDLVIASPQSELESQKPEKPKATKPLSFEEHLAVITKMYADMKEANANQQERLIKMSAELVAKTAEVVDLKDKLASLEVKCNSFKDRYEVTQIELAQTAEAKTELEKRKADLEIQLKSISSAYDAAGKQEVERLKNALKSRLKISFDKYAEIKDEQPDLGYYDALRFILDEIKRTLKTNDIAL